MPNPAAGIDQAIARLRLGYSPERQKPAGVTILSATGHPVEMDKGEHLLTINLRRFKVLTDIQIDALIQYLEEQKALLARSCRVGPLYTEGAFPLTIPFSSLSLSRWTSLSHFPWPRPQRPELS
jgi:hypothetical protein